MTWRPVRGQLGMDAFGAAAFTARVAGELVVEPHTESQGRGHEELYFVARGRATFTLDGDQVDAPAGMFVRYALALAAAASGDEGEARRRLGEAIACVPELAAEARTDAGLAALLDAPAA
jgi:hypothetical protein